MVQKIRILQIGPIPIEKGGINIGGVATHLWDLSNFLKKNFEVGILAINSFEPKKNPVNIDGIKIYGISKKHIIKYLFYIFFNPIIILKLIYLYGGLISLKDIIATFCYYKYIIKDFCPDIIHIHHMDLKFPFIYYASSKQTPIIITVHSLSSIKFTEKKISKINFQILLKNFKLCARNKNITLIFPSRSVYNECSKLIKLEIEKQSHIINNPINISKFFIINKSIARSKIDIPNDKTPIILFIGNLQKHKGIFTLIEAAKILKSKNFNGKFLIIGDGPEKNKVKELIKIYQLEDMINIINYKNHEELIYYYNSADLFVLPSFSESFGITFIEAMACGIPVIGTDKIPKEVIPSQEYGFRFPVKNSHELAYTIEKGLKTKWDKNKIMKFAQSFSWEKRIKEYERIYYSLI
ncbi:MAG: glycosyltransferase family 4 protein [Candidatus Helarchaeota archaeon]